MTEDFVTYKQAVKLKELGFDWEYGKGFQMKSYYNSLKVLGQFDEETVTTEIPAPTLAQVQKWLYEKYRLWIEVTIKAKNDFTLCIVNNYGSIKFINDKEYTDLKTPEQALSVGIDKALGLLKEESNGK